MKKQAWVFAVLLVACMTLSAVQASDKLRYSGDYRYDSAFIEPGSGEAMVLDAVVFRPIGLLTTVIGSAVFVVSLPFSALGGNVGEAADKLVVEPIDYTFKRKLGDL